MFLILVHLLLQEWAQRMRLLWLVTVTWLCLHSVSSPINVWPHMKIIWQTMRKWCKLEGRVRTSWDLLSPASSNILISNEEWYKEFNLILSVEVYNHECNQIPNWWPESVKKMEQAADSSLTMLLNPDAFTFPCSRWLFEIISILLE